MAEIFISYARTTAAKAQQIAGALRELGYGVWRDDELPVHRDYAEVIEERLRAAKAVVVIWSAEAVKSQWVRAEADFAREAGTLVQLRLDATPLPMPFNRIQCADFASWAGDLRAPEWKKVASSISDLVRGRAPTEVGPAAGLVRAMRQVSICVLPFANMSGDPEQEYFSDGISEDITTDLSKVKALSVVARNTAFTFKGRAVDVRRVASELDVRYVLEGSVRKSSRRLRVTAQLVDGEAGDHVWAERYDRDADDIFSIQDEISEAIVEALRLRLLPEEKQAIQRRGTDSAEAYDLFLMARQHTETGNGDVYCFETIVRLCERAIAIDPGYAQAWAKLAAAQMTLAVDYDGGGDAGAAAIERALAIDPNLAEAHSLRARALFREGRKNEAFAEVELAVRQDPDSFDVNYRAGTLYFMDRRFAEAARFYDKAAALSERDLLTPSLLVSALAAQGERERERSAASVTLDRAEKVLAIDRSNGSAISHGAQALASIGDAERARAWIERGLRVDPENKSMAYGMARALVRLRDFDRAVDLLGIALAGEDAGERRRIARVDPDLDPLRADARFRDLIAGAA